MNNANEPNDLPEINSDDISRLADFFDLLARFDFEDTKANNVSTIVPLNAGNGSGDVIDPRVGN